MARDLVLGIDASTTACKAIVWDASGRVLASGKAPIALVSPEPDGWEQDAESWWSGLAQASRQATASLGNRVAALCVTHQRETVVITDRRGTPLGPALVWMDARCAPAVEPTLAKLGLSAGAMLALTGKWPCTTPSLYKIAWLLAREPALAAQPARLCDVGAFLIARLTDRHATSLASADPLGLVDMRARTWAAEVTAPLLPPTLSLPELVEPGEVIAPLTLGAATALGLAAGLPVVAGAGDGQCAGLGAGIVAPGRAYLNLGTAIVSGVLSRTYQTAAAFRTLYGAAPGSYFCETDLKGGTFTLGWLAEKLCRRSDVEACLAELEARAAELAPGSDGLLLVPYFNGVMNPYWDDDAAGVLVGLRGTHGPEHVYRAVLEGIALEQRLYASGVEAVTGPIDELVVMGGGSKSSLWCQILADVLQKPLVRAGVSEATALGAAMLAAVATGLHADLAHASAAMSRLGDRFEPGAASGRYDALYRDVYEGLYPAIAERMKRLAALTRTRRSGRAGGSPGPGA